MKTKKTAPKPAPKPTTAKSKAAEKPMKGKPPAPPTKKPVATPQPAPRKVNAKAAPAAAAAATAQAAVGGMREMPIDLLFESGTNPRKTFSDAELAELAASIGDQGLINPITVRPADDGLFEIVTGARRYRAHQLLGKRSILARVRTMSDLQVVEQQLIENAQRSDVEPLEEADAYQLLRSVHGRNVDDLVATTGKSKAYIYNRLQLCTLGKGAREAVHAGRLSPSVALLVARLPPQLHDRALEDVAPSRPGAEPMTSAAANRLLRDRYMLELEHAGFSLIDAKLLPRAGACSTCPKKTGAQPALFADMPDRNACLDPDCFSAKRQANWEREVRQAEAVGVEVLPPEETAGLEHELTYSWSAWVDLDTPCTLASDPKPTWREVLGKASPEPVLAKVAGRALQLVRRPAAEAAARAQLGIAEPAPVGPAARTERTRTPEELEADAMRAADANKEAWERKLRDTARRRTFLATVRAVERGGADVDEILRALVHAHANVCVDNDDDQVALARCPESIDMNDWLLHWRDEIAKMSRAQLLAVLVQYVLNPVDVSIDPVYLRDVGFPEAPDYPDPVAIAAAAAGVDMDAIARELAAGPREALDEEETDSAPAETTAVA